MLKMAQLNTIACDVCGDQFGQLSLDESIRDNQAFRDSWETIVIPGSVQDRYTPTLVDICPACVALARHPQFANLDGPMLKKLGRLMGSRSGDSR